MHELFSNVLAKRDLSRAGDLFSLEDANIVDDLTAVLLEISTIIAHPRYLETTNRNDQSVIEICVNRCTSCIRQTDTAEQHCKGLLQLLETCLQFNHKPLSKRSEDPPHAKISADIISCIFLNYNKRAVMEQALPVAVRFLSKDNKELSRNLASYLSLAAIEYLDLLVPYTELILNSLLSGNYSLARVVLQLYETTSESAIVTRTRNIIDILPKCDTIDKNILLQLIATIGNNHNGISLLIVDKLPQFFDLILCQTTATHALTVLLRLADRKPTVFDEYIGLLFLTAQKNPSTICLVGQILSTIGKKNKEKAQIALEFILQNLPNTDRSSQTILLQEAVQLCSRYPVLFNDKLTSVIRQRNLNQQSNVTIVNLNSSTSNVPSRSSQNTQNVPLKSQVLVNSTGATSTFVNHQQHPQPINGLHQNVIPTLANSQHYSRSRKFGDSRSTGRLHNGTGNNNAHRSMTRLNTSNINNSIGLHKSMTRLSSSQQINQNPIGNEFNSITNNNDDSFIAPTIPPPLSQNVILTGENKWGIPSTKITSCGVSVTVNHSSPARIRPFSQGSIGKSSSNGLSILNQSTGSISNNISVRHAMTLDDQQSTSSLAPPISLPPEPRHQVIISGPTTTARQNAKSVTLLNVNSNVNHRMSVFEPSMRDTIQHFCEKHLDKIKAYMKTVAHRLPPPAKCIIEERRAKKFAKLHFACQARGDHCLYSKTTFCMRTRHAKVWIHLMFLDLQARSDQALSSYDSSVSSLKHCWDTLKFDRTFITLATSAFPPVREQDLLINELRNSGFFDVFEIGPMGNNNSSNSLDDDVRWGCFLCNHPEKAVFLENNTQPVIEGQLKEKKGKWRLFRRWRTRYFTLSGAQLRSSGDASIDINQIRSVKVSRHQSRPTCFEIFTSTNQTLILKPTDGEKAEEWVQYLSIVVARHSQARDGFTKSNSLPSSGSRREINSRTAML